MLERFQPEIEQIETSLIRLLPESTPEPLKSAMHYAVTAGGKRIRPLLTLLTCDMLGGQRQHALATACGIEMIHTYSLIHDDLPAMDDDDLRRGKPTLHIEYDEATAILAGDALQSLAFELIASDSNLTPSTQSNLIMMIAKAIGPEGMVAGQVLDMQAENRTIEASALRRVHHHKTGDLIAASIKAGAIIAGATKEELAQLEQFGYALGLAFQIRDDLLDVLGTTEQLGKPMGSDMAQNKSTFTSIYGIDQAKAQLDAVIGEAHSALEVFSNKNDRLVSLTQFVAERLN